MKLRRIADIKGWGASYGNAVQLSCSTMLPVKLYSKSFHNGSTFTRGEDTASRFSQPPILQLPRCDHASKKDPPIHGRNPRWVLHNSPQHTTYHPVSVLGCGTTNLPAEELSCRGGYTARGDVSGASVCLHVSLTHFMPASYLYIEILKYWFLFKKNYIQRELSSMLGST